MAGDGYRHTGAFDFGQQSVEPRLGLGTGHGVVFGGVHACKPFKK
jgi:hypothetical protein